MKHLLPILLCFIFFTGNAVSLAPRDSVGVKRVGGKLFVIHEVEEKETLYGLSRRYRVSVSDILEYNTELKAGLKIGQEVRIPWFRREKKPKLASADKLHIVKEKETLYSISRLYQVRFEDIRKWNELEDTNLKVGQELVIRQTGNKEKLPKSLKKDVGGGTIHMVEIGETVFSISRKYNIPMDSLRTWNNLQRNEISVGQKLVVGRTSARETRPTQKVVEPIEAVPAQVDQEQTIPAVSTASDSVQKSTAVPLKRRESDLSTKRYNSSEEVAENGLAEVIAGTRDTRKYLALHRTAKIGTIMKVINEMNGRQVFVRVSGKLPDTGVNDKILIKISQSAYNRLGAIDKRFRVKISYYNH